MFYRKRPSPRLLWKKTFTGSCIGKPFLPVLLRVFSRRYYHRSSIGRDLLKAFHWRIPSIGEYLQRVYYGRSNFLSLLQKMIFSRSSLGVDLLQIFYSWTLLHAFCRRIPSTGLFSEIICLSTPTEENLLKVFYIEEDLLKVF